MAKNLRISHIGSCFMALLAVVIMVVRPIADLDDLAHIMLGGIILALCFCQAKFQPHNLNEKSTTRI